MAFSSSSSSLSAAGFNEYNIQLQAAALKATKSAITLPSDLAFHRSLDSGLSNDLDACSEKALTIANTLLNLALTASTFSKGKLKLEEEDDVVDNFQASVVDAMDQLLERADICLDQFLGRIKAPAIAVNPAKPAPKKKTTAPRGRLDPALQHASHLAKPQLQFKAQVDNHNPWRPSLKHKYNAQVPLGYNLREAGEESSNGSEVPYHPYRYEITHLTQAPHLYSPPTPSPPNSFESTPFTYVDTPQALHAMLEKLCDAKEIAVDLEYHNYRTYRGFVCLMQVSTRGGDWVVDLLVPEVREEASALNEVFTDPGIVKVFHGAESDIVWLQQDFNIYVVNLFDTYHASRVLDFPRHGLAALLEMYCDFVPDKRYQLADWRIRPLPEEMLEYARSDTHYLLYIYDNLRHALLDRASSSSPSASQSPPPMSPLEEVMRRSTETSLRVYENEEYDPEGGGAGGWDTMARKWNKAGLSRDAVLRSGLERARKEVYRAVHAWRDRVAREEDESTRYVLSNHHLFSLAERPPADMTALLATFQPVVPPVIRRRAKELLDRIRECVKVALTEPKKAEAVEITPTSADGTFKEGEEKMDVDEEPRIDVPPSTSTASRLWSQSLQLPTVPKAAISTLFGASTAAAVPNAASSVSPAYSTSRSSLFGDLMGSQTSVSVSPLSRFQEVVEKIHRNLVIAPSVPKLAKPSVQAPPKAAEPAVSGQPVEIAYVPPSQRQTAKAAEIVDDTIVMVGQRQKKRKRVEKAKKREMSGEAEMDVEPFDYSSVPNILDDAPETAASEEVAPKKKKRQNKAGVYEYGNFPAPPKAQREVKSGNQSRTFR